MEIHPSAHEDGETFDVQRFAGEFTEGLLNRLVRAQVTKGTVQDKGKKLYQIRVENVSPLILNGLALLGTDSPEKRGSQGAGGNLGSAPPKPDGPRHRRRRQVARAQEGNPLVALNLSGL